MGNIPKEMTRLSLTTVLSPSPFFAGHGQDKSISAGQDSSCCQEKVGHDNKEGQAPSEQNYPSP